MNKFDNLYKQIIMQYRMKGPKAAERGQIDEIKDMRQKLDSGTVEFNFMKHDPDGGENIIRHAIGTTSQLIIPTQERRKLDPSYDEKLAGYEERSAYIIWFWDLQKNAIRCFNTNRFEGIIKYTPAE